MALHRLGETARAIADAEAARMIYEAIEAPAAEKARRLLESWSAEQ